MTDDERMKLVSTESSLGMGTEPRIPSAIAGLEGFSLSNDEEERPRRDLDASNLFNLPAASDDDDDEDEDDRRNRR
jgi:uncharacterized protein